jgi:two-component system chemotaxis sensor kinase CheA
MDQIVETVRITQGDVHRVKAAETFVLRNAITPIVWLSVALALVPAPDRREELAIMVVEAGGHRFGLVVDAFRERMEVIVRPLEGVLEGLHGFSGTSLMGDGQVLLVLDLKALI